MEAYVGEKSQENENNFLIQNESFEDIDSTEENDGDDQDDQFIYNLDINFSGVCRKCGMKRETFKFNNTFHAHIRECKRDEKLYLSGSKSEDLFIIESHAKVTAHKGYGFRSYQYVTAWMKICLTMSVIEGVADTGCVMFLVDTNYLNLTLSRATILKMPAPINVRGIDNALHQSCFYVMLDLYLDGLVNGKKARGHIRREFHLVDGLKCKLLMSLDVMVSEEMMINLTDKSLIISTCENLMISIRVNLKPNSRIRRIVHSKELVKVSSNSIISILTYLRGKKLSSNRDFLFESNNDTLTKSLSDLDDFYTHVCDCNLAFVHVRNARTDPVIISSRTRLGILTEYDEERCFQVEPELHEWAVVCNEAEAEADFS
jgi:hypothetical protein